MDLTDGEQPAPDIGGALQLAHTFLDESRGGQQQRSPALQPHPLPQLKGQARRACVQVLYVRKPASTTTLGQMYRRAWLPLPCIGWGGLQLACYTIAGPVEQATTLFYCQESEVELTEL